MTIEEILWALLKTDTLLIVVLIIYSLTEWEGLVINEREKATRRYKVANNIFKVVTTILPLIIIAIIWV